MLRLVRAARGAAAPAWRTQQMLARGLASNAADASAGAGASTADASGDAQTSTHFGFQQVNTAEKKPMVAAVFHRVAERYDMMNDFMSAGVHRLWKDWFVDQLQIGGAPLRVLDVAGGTGDIAFRIAQKLRASDLDKSEICICDINSSMLEVGRERAARKFPGAMTARFKWEQGDAEQLTQFADNSFDIYTIAFGIRNVTHIDKVLAEAHRVLKPGGRFLCLEFSRVPNPLIRAVYDAYSFNIIPLLGERVANDRASYQYLVESIRQFPPQEEFKAMIERAGFKHASYTNYTLGVVAVHSGFKM